MSPIYEYECPNGHVTEALRDQTARHFPETCPACRQPAEFKISLPAKRTDGIYSYAPNIGSADDFERKKADADERADRTGTYKP